MNLEKIILKYLTKNQGYAQKVLPFLKTEYFNETSDSAVFSVIRDYIIKYNRPPTFESLVIEIDGLTLKHDVKEQAKNVAQVLNEEELEKQEDWLLDVTEKFCQEKALYTAMVHALQIMKGENKDQLSKGAIPTLLQDALGVTFDPNVGHDYLEESSNRYDFYHNVEGRVPFDIDLLNTITQGGIPDKTLNVIVGGVNVGKTLILCHLAASYLAMGYDVLYITLEMAEERIAERIDANLLNIPMDELAKIPKDVFEKKVETLKNKTQGKLIIKEFPTASASVLHFRALLNELKLKKNFKPKVVLVDYINICASSRVKLGGSVNSYFFIKFIAEELRGLAVEQGLIIWTATQLTRTGFGSSDPDMTDVAESFGLPATADFMLIIIMDEDLERLSQYLFKQIKNRYNTKSVNKAFTVGVDFTKMRIYDVEQKAQENIVSTKVENSKTEKFKGLKVS